jgi:IMP dehydrogenase
VIKRKNERGQEVLVESYRGMASSEVQDDYHGGMAEWKTAEGVSVDVPYLENEEAVIANIIGGLRSGLTYGGADTIRELQRKLDYIRITPAGRHESLPHRTI